MNWNVAIQKKLLSDTYVSWLIWDRIHFLRMPKQELTWISIILNEWPSKHEDWHILAKRNITILLDIICKYEDVWKARELRDYIISLIHSEDELWDFNWVTGWVYWIGKIYRDEHLAMDYDHETDTCFLWSVYQAAQNFQCAIPSCP